MTATDELRRMLDERGVEWWDMSDEYEWYTEWVPEMLVKHHHRHRAEPVGFFESTWRKHGEMANGLVLFGNKHHRHCIYDLTPEQAIAATLGAGTCHDVHEPPKGTTFWPSPHFKCSECGATYVSMEYVFFCPNCGRKVVDA